MTSCNFSPGRIPVTLIGKFGAMDFARSTTRIDGILGTNISPPCIRSKFLSTNSIPSSNFSQYLVIRSSVIGKNSAPSSTSFLKKGTTEPRDPTTLPYLTTANLVSLSPTKLLAATKSLSEASLVAPYKLIGFAALSVESAITLFTWQ